MTSLNNYLSRFRWWHGYASAAWDLCSFVNLCALFDATVDHAYVRCAWHLSAALCSAWLAVKAASRYDRRRANAAALETLRKLASWFKG